MPRLAHFALAVGIVFTLCAGCGDRIRFASEMKMVMSFFGLSAVNEIEARLDPAMLERLGGEVPAVWPDNLPAVSMLIPLDIAMLIDRSELQQLGSDLAAAPREGFEIRLRRIHWSLDSDFRHPLIDLEVRVGTEGQGGLEFDEAHLVGHLEGLEIGHGELVFAPGGRRAMIDHLLDERYLVLVRATMLFDTNLETTRPTDSATLELNVYVDVLK